MSRKALHLHAGFVQIMGASFAVAACDPQRERVTAPHTTERASLVTCPRCRKIIRDGPQPQRAPRWKWMAAEGCKLPSWRHNATASPLRLERVQGGADPGSWLRWPCGCARFISDKEGSA